MSRGIQRRDIVRDDRDPPQLTRPGHRPSPERIRQVVSDPFGIGVEEWHPVSRQDDARGGVAAFLARREFGYPSREGAAALHYRSHGRVRNAIGRIENGTKLLDTPGRPTESPAR